MRNSHLDKQEQLIKLFRVDDEDALAILQFALGELTWTDLSDHAQNKLLAYYQRNSRVADVPQFIRASLITELGL